MWHRFQFRTQYPKCVPLVVTGIHSEVKGAARLQLKATEGRAAG